MRLFDVLLGRTKPVESNLDALFGLPGAVVTLDVAEGLEPSGQAGVCYKPASGQPFAQTTEQFEQLLGLDTTTSVTEQSDTYGYHWVVIHDADNQKLVTEVHMVNTTLQEQGYGPQLLCTVFGFRPKGTAAPASLYLVYLYKRGAFYPFMPTGPEKRDLEGEMRLQNVLAEDLKIEPDKERWMPLWGVPVH